MDTLSANKFTFFCDYCDLYSKNKIGIRSSSDGEYGSIDVCLKCILKMSVDNPNPKDIIKEIEEYIIEIKKELKLD